MVKATRKSLIVHAVARLPSRWTTSKLLVPPGYSWQLVEMASTDYQPYSGVRRTVECVQRPRPDPRGLPRRASLFLRRRHISTLCDRGLPNRAPELHVAAATRAHVPHVRAPAAQRRQRQ